MRERPDGITDAHLAKGVCVYARQSTAKQVEKNTGSGDHQRNQVRYALMWGWSENEVDLIDEDLGASGMTTERRTGYLRMVEGIRNGTYGAIFVSDLSRLGRNAIELLTFLDLCRSRNVLIVVNGNVCNLADSGELFGHRVTSLVTEYENIRRTEMMHAGRRAKVQSGKSVSAPPRGYVKTATGGWEFHPDPAVQEAVRAVYRTFLEKRGLVPTVRALKRRGIKIPRQRRGDVILWMEPTIDMVSAILHHEAYKGVYVYPRCRQDLTLGTTRGGFKRMRPALPEERFVIPDHHPAYVTTEEWDEIQNILALHAPTKVRRNLGPGSALVQGIIRCGRHRNHAMCTRYICKREDGRSIHGYRCGGEQLSGGPFCGSVSGFRVDAAVVEAVLERLSPPRLAIVNDVWRQARSDARHEERRRELELRRASQAVEDARFRLDSVAPTNPLVKEDYETRLEQALRAQRSIEARVTALSSVVDDFTDQTWDELTALCRDLPTLWRASVTSDRDRKQLIRILVREVIIERHERERIQLRIRWTDASPDTPKEIKMSPYAHGKMAEMAARGMTVDKIVDGLNADGLLTRQGNPWSKNAVQLMLREMRKRNG